MGYQCVDCVSAGRRDTRETVTIAGARLASKPIVVPVLIAMNVLIYLVTAIQSGSGTNNGGSGLFTMFALWPMLVGAGEWWRLFTSGFLHLGIAHLAMNMIAMWVIGRDLELVLGRVRFSAVYLLSLLGGSAAVFLFGAVGAPVAGASGAVYGMIGGIGVAAFRLKVSLKPVLAVIALNVVFTLVVPYISNVNISALGHFGGLAVGGVATAALVYAPRNRRVYWQVGTLGALFLVLLALLITRDTQLGDLVCFRTPTGTQCGIRS